MKHSPRFKQVQLYYKRGQWDKKKVHDAVDMGWITPEEYEIITGDPFVPTEEESE